LTPAVILARIALIEARRGGLPWLVLASLAIALGLAGFLSQVAVTESLQLQVLIAGALLRACAAFLVAIHVATSMVREAGDKGMELILSFPLSRGQYYLGKLAGFVACGAVVAGCFALPLLIWSPPAAVAHWGLSLLAETAMVAAISLFFVITLAQVVPAIAATAGLYLLARVIGSIQSIATGPLASDTVSHSIARHAIDAVALVLPRLDAATRADWLVYGPPAAADYFGIVAGLILYAALASAAGMFDFHRRNL
jgi:ABC-type transport system involved in multi-copper enzyme maturation permease subunit